MTKKNKHPLRIWREANDVSIAWLAGKIKLSRGYLSMLELGQRGISIDLATHISRFTGRYSGTPVPVSAFSGAGKAKAWFRTPKKKQRPHRTKLERLQASAGLALPGAAPGE